jgi:uncharacterized membrane protein YfcA
VIPELSSSQWIWAVLAALGIGVSKSGFAGVGLFHVAVFATLLGAKESTGVVLPMLIVGDIGAVVGFKRHSRWDYVRRMLPPSLVGVVIGWLVLGRLDDLLVRQVLGVIVLGLAIMQFARMFRPNLFTHVPHKKWFIWTIGLLVGVSTMLANAAGPIMAVYLLAVSLPKMEFVGTTAWFFLILNVLKLPFSYQLGLITGETLTFNAKLAPVILVGLVLGSWAVHRVPQKVFDVLLLTFATVMALKLMGIWGKAEPTTRQRAVSSSTAQRAVFPPAGPSDYDDHSFPMVLIGKYK